MSKPKLIAEVTSGELEMSMYDDGSVEIEDPGFRHWISLSAKQLQDLGKLIDGEAK